MVAVADDMIVGEWTYQFTKDGSVIWQQKPVAPEAAAAAAAAAAASSSSEGSAKTAGEPVLFGKTDAAAALPPPTALGTPASAHAVTQQSLSSSISHTADGSVSHASHYGTAPTALHTLSHDLSVLTVKENSEPRGQAHASTTGEPQQAGSSAQGSNHHHHGDPLIHGHQASVAIASSSTQKDSRKRPSVRQKEGKARAGSAAPSRSQKAARHPKSLDQVVGREKGKRFDSVAIVQNWQCG